MVVPLGGTSNYAAWRPSANPVSVPLGGHPQIQYLSRLAPVREPSIYPAWRPSTNPVFVPLGTRPIQNLARKNPFPRLRGKVAAGRKGGIQNQDLSRLAAIREPSICPAWRPSANPAFIPLGGCPRTQCLSRLAAVREPSVYPAWRPSTNPVFVPLGTRPIQNLARKNPFPRLRGKVAAGRKGGIQNQDLSRLAAIREPSIYPAWRPSVGPVFVPLGGHP